MRQPASHRVAAGSARADLGRFANVLALLAMLLNQPLAMLHAATDAEHLSPRAHHLHQSPRSSRADDPHELDGEPPAAVLHHHTCDVCLLVGSTLPPLAARIESASDWHPWFRPVAARSAATDKRPRLGDPARAPPGTHLI